ncbi:MAG: ATP-dependent zinc metalloprotease FtsH [Bacillota bacterium]
MKKSFRTPLIYLVILAVIIFLASGLDPMGVQPEELEYTQFLDAARNEKVAAVEITLNELVGRYKDSKIKPEEFPQSSDFKVTIPSVDAFRSDMAAIVVERNPEMEVEQVTNADYGFDTKYNPPPEASIFEVILPYLLIFGALGLFYYFMMQQQGGGNKVMSFGKSRARTQTDAMNRVSFADVAGADEEKEELAEVVEFMRNPKRFVEMGARIPKGVLLVGPPGTGKTLLARAAAGEADVPFFSISGSDFVEMFVGVGASRVRDLFNTAKKSAPAIVFIDEIDAVGRQRGAGLGGGHDEREQTLNQLLVEMDGFSPNEGIIIIAATNRPDILDPALLRPGRFDRQITVNYPDVKGREEILKVHSKKKPFEPDVDLKVLAKRTPGFTGADLENVLNEAAILTARFHKTKIGMPELEEAITRVVVGPEKRSRVITAEDRRITAYHEAGHAIVALSLPGCDPVHEISVIPRGMAGGYTMTLPKEDLSHRTKSKLLDEIAMLLGGRVAETVVLQDVSTGAYNDLQRASELARRMVVEFGMSDDIGPVFLGGQTEVFIAKDWGHTRNYSEEVAARVDREIRRILEEQFERAKACLETNREGLEKVVAALIEHERLSGEEFEAIYKGEDVETVLRRSESAPTPADAPKENGEALKNGEAAAENGEAAKDGETEDGEA